MEMFINTEYQHIIMAPCKTGSSTIERMFQRRWNWHNIFLGKPIKSPQNILLDYLSPYEIKSNKVLLFVRNPFDWIISGFRHMQDQNRIDFTHSPYPDTLKDHLIAMKNGSIKDHYWQNHCLYQPADFLKPEYQIVKLENFAAFVRYLDKNLNSDYDKPLDNDYKINVNKKVPFPEIGNFEEQLIIELTRKAAILTCYDVPKSIKSYKKRYTTGELNEFLTKDVQVS